MLLYYTHVHATEAIWSTKGAMCRWRSMKAYNHIKLHEHIMKNLKLGCCWQCQLVSCLSKDICFVVAISHDTYVLQTFTVPILIVESEMKATCRQAYTWLFTLVGMMRVLPLITEWQLEQVTVTLWCMHQGFLRINRNHDTAVMTT